jgi:hypothetical protein
LVLACTQNFTEQGKDPLKCVYLKETWEKAPVGCYCGNDHQTGKSIRSSGWSFTREAGLEADFDSKHLQNQKINLSQEISQ